MIKKINDLEANLNKERVVAVNAIKKISTLKTEASQSKKLEDLLKKLPKNLLADEELMMSAVSLVGGCFKLISPDLQKNKKVALAALQTQNTLYGAGFYLMPDELKGDRDIILASVQMNGWVIKEIDKKFQEDWDIAMAAVVQNGLCMEEVPAKLLDNKDFITEVLAKQNYHVFDFVSDKFKDDKEFIKKALVIEPWIYQFISQRLKEDEEIINFVVKKDSDVLILEYGPQSLSENKDFVLSIVRVSPSQLQYASAKLRSDPDVIDATRAKSPIDAARYALKAWSNDVLYFAPDFRRELTLETDDVKAKKMFTDICEGLLKYIPTQIAAKRIKNSWLVIAPPVLRNFESYKDIKFSDNKEERYFVQVFSKDCLKLIDDLIVKSQSYSGDDRVPEVPFFIAVELGDGNYSYSKETQEEAIRLANEAAIVIKDWPIRTYIYSEDLPRELDGGGVGFVEQTFDASNKKSVLMGEVKLNLGDGYFRGLFTKLKPEIKYVAFRNLFQSTGCQFHQYVINKSEIIAHLK